MQEFIKKKIIHQVFIQEVIKNDVGPVVANSIYEYVANNPKTSIGIAKQMYTQLEKTVK